MELGCLFFSSVEIAVYIKICMLATRLIWIVFDGLFVKEHVKLEF